MVEYEFYLAHPSVTAVTGLTVRGYSTATDVTTVNCFKLDANIFLEALSKDINHKISTNDKQRAVQLNKNKKPVTISNWFIGNLAETTNNEGEKTARFRNALQYAASNWHKHANKNSILFLTSGFTAADEYGYNNIEDASNSKGWVIWTNSQFTRPKYTIKNVQFSVDSSLNLTVKNLELEGVTN